MNKMFTVLGQIVVCGILQYAGYKAYQFGWNSYVRYSDAKHDAAKEAESEQHAEEQNGEVD